MTQLWISLPGSTVSRYYQHDPGGTVNFRFVPFAKYNAISENLSEVTEPSSALVLRPDPENHQISREGYLQLMAKTIDHIRSAGLGKIVVSRYRDHQLKPDPNQVYHDLVEKYPDACVYLFSHPHWGTWVGATPELLLTKKGGSVVSMSLAGTTSVDEATALGSKEESEQSMVTDFISTAFEEAGISDVQVAEPRVIQAGQLLHLQTMIEGKVSDHQATEQLLELLHPTPAVAGLPREAALTYLKQNERYDRELYTGYFGLADQDGFSYFVNLRCMQFFQNSVRLYAGGGITADSVPAAEWEETERKMNTVGSVFL